MRTPSKLSRPSLVAVALLPLLLALLAPLAPAQKGQSLPVFGADLQEAQAQLFHRVHEGALQVALEIEITEGFHLYHSEMGNPEAIGYPTSVTLGGEGVRWSAVRFPEPLVLEQIDTWVYAHEHTIVLYALGETEGDPAAVAVSADIDGLTCEDDGTCVPYAESLTSQGEGGRADLFAAFPDDLAVGGAAETDAGGSQPSAVQARGTGTGPEASAVAVERTVAEYDAISFPDYQPVGGEDGSDRGLAVWLLLAFVAGIILNVMPCVLPVISIKVLSFVQQAGEDRSRILALGVAFAAGIVVVFLGLATLAAFFGVGWGEQFQSQGFLVAMIGLVFAFSLSMFGVYELGVPSGVGAMAGGAPKEGLGDAFFKGMLATVLATPCSGPFLGSTLAWTVSQPVLVIYAIFLSLGLGMAIPYVVLTANPAFLKLVPKPGPWMDTFKESMGFVLLGTVIFLMISLYTNLLLVTVTFLVFVALGCWWWGRFSRTAATAGKKWATLLVALAIIAGGARLSYVEFNDVLNSDTGDWEAFDHERLEQLLAEGTPVFVDWTATWCANCHVNKNVVFDSDEVMAAMSRKGVVRMLADVSVRDDTAAGARTRMLTRLKTKLGGSAIPFAALFRPDEPRAPFVLFDVVTKGQVLDVVDQL